MKWKCSDGTIKELSELSDNHLNNAIKFIKNIGDELVLKELEKEFKRREYVKTFQSCPWCGSIMLMKYYKYEDPYPDVGINFTEKLKQLTCVNKKCGAKGPRIDLK